MDLNDFKNLAEAFQAIAIAVAVIIGGVWAVYRFWSLKELGRARWEMEKLQKSLTERATINVTLFARSETNPGGSGYYIEVSASLTNIGNRTEVLDWSDGGVFTARVLGKDKGNVVLGEFIKTNQGTGMPLLSSALAPSETTIFSFLVPVDEQGFYYVVFSVAGSPEETEELKRQHARVGALAPTTVVRWWGETYVKVSGHEQAVS